MTKLSMQWRNVDIHPSKTATYKRWQLKGEDQLFILICPDSVILVDSLGVGELTVVRSISLAGSA